jgi:enoyl-CoA hydratase/carnithine racemase
MDPFLQIERDGAVWTVTMSAAQTRNALTGNSAVDEFVALCDAVAHDDSVRVVVVTGADPAFSSGGNVKDMRRFFDEAATPAAIRAEYRHGIQRLTRSLYHLEVPAIAAVNGAAIGAGCDLACMCDIRIASERASFAESFIKVGIVPGDGGAWLLPRVVGMSRALEMSFTGDALGAAEALQCGLVSRVVPHAELLPEARTLAAASPPIPDRPCAYQAPLARGPAARARQPARSLRRSAGHRAQDRRAPRGGDRVHREASAGFRAPPDGSLSDTPAPRRTAQSLWYPHRIH